MTLDHLGRVNCVVCSGDMKISTIEPGFYPRSTITFRCTRCDHSHAFEGVGYKRRK